SSLRALGDRPSDLSLADASAVRADLGRLTQEVDALFLSGGSAAPRAQPMTRPAMRSAQAAPVVDVERPLRPAVGDRRGPWVYVAIAIVVVGSLVAVAALSLTASPPGAPTAVASPELPPQALPPTAKPAASMAA